MKMKWISGVILLVALNSCSSAGESEKKEIMSSATVEHEHEHEHGEHLELDNGKKWKVEPHMMVFIRNMEQATMKQSNTGKPSHQELAEYIDGQLDSLTSNCTMTGKAHDELHKWLLPFIDLADLYLNEQDETEKAQLHTQIIDSFESFNTYFE